MKDVLDLVVRSLSHVLVPLFCVGMIGATIVVSITFVHDLVDFFDDEDEKAPSKPSQS